MDSLLANEDIDEVFKSDINLMPADVAYVTGINAEGMKNAKMYVTTCTYMTMCMYMYM